MKSENSEEGEEDKKKEKEEKEEKKENTRDRSVPDGSDNKCRLKQAKEWLPNLVHVALMESKKGCDHK